MSTLAERLREMAGNRRKTPPECAAALFSAADAIEALEKERDGRPTRHEPKTKRNASVGDSPSTAPLSPAKESER